MTHKLTKAEIVSAIALSCGLSKAVAGRAVETAVNTITHALANGDAVRIARLGSFNVRDRESRVVYVPSTGQPMNLPPRRIVRFRPASSLKDALFKDSDAK